MKLKLKIIAALILFSVVKSYAQQADFSGQWKINVQKSDFGIVPHFMIFDQATIRQTKDSIYLTTVYMDKDYHDTSPASAKYALNGSPSQRVFQDTIKTVGSCAFTDDKKSMIKKMDYISNNDAQHLLRTSQDNWSLSSNGTELIVERNFKAFLKNEHSYIIKAVYDKQ
jgi:hypothetical protein